MVFVINHVLLLLLLAFDSELDNFARVVVMFIQRVIGLSRNKHLLSCIVSHACDVSFG